MNDTTENKPRRKTGGEQMRFDAIRMIEAVVMSLCLLGAGMNFITRGRERVKSLTTATSEGASPSGWCTTRSPGA